MINIKILKKPEHQNLFKNEKAEVEINHYLPHILNLKKIAVDRVVIILPQINLIKSNMLSNTSLKNSTT